MSEPYWEPLGAAAGLTEQQMFSLRSTVMLHGGGNIVWNGTRLTWSTRFIVISKGTGSLTAVVGHLNIDCPGVGQVVPGIGVADDTVTSAGIAIPSWSSLYYILPLGQANQFSVPGNFRVVQYGANVVIPPEWVLIATRNEEVNPVLWVAPGVALALAGDAYRASPTPVIQTGTVNMASMANATPYSSAVTFPIAFPATPAVLLTVQSYTQANGHGINLVALTPSTTGFTLWIYNENNNQTALIRWLAVKA